MTKYKQYVNKMLEDYKDDFDRFKKIHDQYSLNPNKLQDDFNKEGLKIMEIIREYENRLCANTERGMYNKFSANLAEKFQNEVRKLFPMIDHIGIISESPTEVKNEPNYFSIKKIKLS